MNTTKSCQKCGTELSDNDAQGLCPCCLLKVGLDTLTKTANLADGTAPPAPLRPLPKAGDRFGRFQILRELGRGGMGAVFEAEEQDTGRRVALKVISQRLASPENRARFLREGRLAASINHPNSVYVYSTEEIEGTPAIAMELVAGGTLQDRVNKSGPLAVSAAVDAILQIIAGLEAAQSIGILHRDIKPGNCFVDADGTVKIGDFGLSISSAARAEANVTAAGTLLGTPAFCSPEQLRGEELNARSDLYSVGGTLFYLLTGRAPFEGLNGPQLIANVLEKHAPSPRQFRKEIPTGLAGAILRCLEKQAGERFRSYDALRQSLAPYSSAVSTPAPLGLRFLAGLLDNWFLGMIGMAVFMLGFGGMTIDASGHSIKWWTVGISFGLVSVLYFAIMEGLWGATLGKALCRLRVVGANNSPLGFLRGLARASLYTMLPWLPSGIWAIWVAASGKLPAILHGSAMMLLNHLSCLLFFAYLLFASLFCTMRRRNGFAAIHDLITRTRVITRKALLKRPVLSAIASPPPAVETNPQIGPYHVLGTLGKSDGIEWLLGYDLRLLRKVWLCVVPAGTPPVPASWRSIGRVGRLRWLTGRRSPEANWDAFEAVAGQPLLNLVRTRNLWSHVRFWLYDLSYEIGAAEKDGTLPPVLALDRVWIGDDGRAKLLDFPAPGVIAGWLPQDGVAAKAPSCPPHRSAQEFLGAVAAVALTGAPDAVTKSAGDVAVPLPLHARGFLKNLPKLPDMEAVIRALQPLLSRVAVVSRLRRAAVVASCIAFPLCISVMATLTMVHKWSMLLLIASMSLLMYAVIPALITALLFRGGLVLRIAKVTFVRRDGARASRLRVFWRDLVSWSPVVAYVGVTFAQLEPLQGLYTNVGVLHVVLAAGLVCALVVISVALPGRGLADRLAGTWPVPR